MEKPETHSLQELAARLMGVIDLTTLNGSDNSNSVSALCRLAREVHDLHGMPYPAAVCVYPVFVRQVAKELRGTGIRIASVAGAFPSGQSPLKIRLEEVRYCLDEGADEIDMVISRGRMIAGDEAFIREEILAMKEICGDKHLKAILETGELRDPGMIASASRIALDAGADFIKTSTGKVSPAATLEAAEIMLRVLAEYRNETGMIRGFKPAGGISDMNTALGYVRLAEEIMGIEFISAHTFRIGASSLVKDILAR